jgi:hypothetical protein
MVLTTGIIGGTTYRFRVRASNIYGWGAFSSSTSIKAATIPSQMAIVTTSIDRSTGGVLISWVAPYDGSQSITKYAIMIADWTGSNYYEDSVNCDGSSVSVISNMYCIVPMNVIISAPFGNNVLDLLIKVTVKAYNSYGWSSPSNVNLIGAKVRTVPLIMNTPIADSYSDSDVVLSWSALVSP